MGKETCMHLSHDQPVNQRDGWTLIAITLGDWGVSSELCGICSGHSLGTILLSMGLLAMASGQWALPNTHPVYSICTGAMMMFAHTKHQQCPTALSNDIVAGTSLSRRRFSDVSAHCSLLNSRCPLLSAHCPLLSAQWPDVGQRKNSCCCCHFQFPRFLSILIVL